MSQNAYKDYPPDQPLIKYPVEPGKGIIGCEMHEINGWGHSYDQHFPKKKKGLWRTLLDALFGVPRRSKEEPS